MDQFDCLFGEILDQLERLREAHHGELNRKLLGARDVSETCMPDEGLVRPDINCPSVVKPLRPIDDPSDGPRELLEAPLSRKAPCLNGEASATKKALATMPSKGPRKTRTQVVFGNLFGHTAATRLNPFGGVPHAVCAAPQPLVAPRVPVPGKVSRRCGVDIVGLDSTLHEWRREAVPRIHALFSMLNKTSEGGLVTARDFILLFEECGMPWCSVEAVEQPLHEFCLIMGCETIGSIEYSTFKALILVDLDTLDPDLSQQLNWLRERLFQCEHRKLIMKYTGLKTTSWRRESDGPARKDILETLIGSVIILNALVIGISTDVDPMWYGWMALEAVFTIVFITELFVKFFAVGLREYVIGTDWHWNIFDSLVVIAAVVDFLNHAIRGGTSSGNLAMLRIVRLVRLMRLLKLLRLKIFKELKLMIMGVFFGLRTLGWALILFLLVLYVVAVVMRQVIVLDKLCVGHNASVMSDTCPHSERYLSEHYEELFGDVPTCMFTLARCFTDGCESTDGTPIIPYMWNVYGYPLLIFYTFIMFFVTFGLFNLITAILVENTVEAAKIDNHRVSNRRKAEQIRVAHKLLELLERMSTRVRRLSVDCADADGESTTEPLLKTVANNVIVVVRRLRLWRSVPDGRIFAMMQKLAVTRDAFEKVIYDPAIERILDDLDVSISSREGLFDVLDADGNNVITAEELVGGILRLRGPADKGDTVAALLAVRSLQKNIAEMALGWTEVVAGAQSLPRSATPSHLVDPSTGLSATSGGDTKFRGSFFSDAANDSDHGDNEYVEDRPSLCDEEKVEICL